MKDAIHILAIDDEQVILDSIVKLCSLEDWQVDTAIAVYRGRATQFCFARAAI